MNLVITKHSENFSTSPQISVADVAEIAALGFKSIVNNRPDGEGGAEQPTSEQIRAEAERLGLGYKHIPVIPGNMSAENVSQCAAFMANSAGPLLAFCRTGTRSSNLYQTIRATLGE
ncbi:MAG: TIGR01244 family phosphatase [Methylophilaceae bacterium]|nr:TIGR01244 family phosphatase [Methylophilaceae bacterium]